MKNIFVLLIALFLLNSFQNPLILEKSVNRDGFKTAIIDTLFQDNISIRAIVVDANKIWYTANNSRFGFYDIAKKSRKESTIDKGDLKLEFRSIAENKENVFILNVGNPALLYQIDKLNLHTTLVYQENHEKVFYDSLTFWNTKEGIAIGDLIDGAFSIIITRDGGMTWKKIPAIDLPKLVLGEAAFAASNTNIVTKGTNTWVFSGGIKARVFYSADKGKTWTVYNTPIIQGKAMTGIFTAAFYDSKNGFIAGGDYDVLGQNFGNKAFTKDGGKTWQLIAENNGFGYASCVQYVPGGKGKSLVSVGASGLFYSSNRGESWEQLSKDSSLYTLRFIDNKTAIAAGKNKMVRIRFQQ
jgi:photosystem II stability/assembly factor-like uncharacterized protein